MSFKGGPCMRRTLVALRLAAALMLSAATMHAQHSFDATYHDGKTQKIEGKVVQFLFRNPHSFLHVEAPDDQGMMQTWAVEWGGGGQLGKEGVTGESIKAGDRVVVVGEPGRNPDEHRLRMVDIQRLE